jgi:PIN domain nuclease of toxin-antitoxin system
MRLLLDTHVFLWWLRDDRKLSTDARGAITDSRSVVHVSAATVWEASIKEQLGRLDAGGADLVEEITANGFVELPIAARHARRSASLPLHHRDPFDRMLVAQAELESLTLVTHDRPLTCYGVRLLLT